MASCPRSLDIGHRPIHILASMVSSVVDRRSVSPWLAPHYLSVFQARLKTAGLDSLKTRVASSQGFHPA